MKYIERNSLYCSLVKNDLLLKNPQVRRFPVPSAPTVPHLPRQVESPGLRPFLLADDFESFDAISLSTENGLIWTPKDFINSYLSDLYGFNDFFLEYRKAQNCLNVLDGHKQVRFNETLVSRCFFETKMADLKNLNAAMGVDERVELQRVLESLDEQLLSETNAQMAQSSQEIILRHLAADHHNQQSVFISSVVQSVDDEISAALHSLGDDGVGNQMSICLKDFGQPKTSETCGGFLSIPSKSDDPTTFGVIKPSGHLSRGYVLSDGGSNGGFGPGDGNGFGGGSFNNGGAPPEPDSSSGAVQIALWCFLISVLAVLYQWSLDKLDASIKSYLRSLERERQELSASSQQELPATNGQAAKILKAFQNFRHFLAQSGVLLFSAVVRGDTWRQAVHQILRPHLQRVAEAFPEGIRRALGPLEWVVRYPRFFMPFLGLLGRFVRPLLTVGVLLAFCSSFMGFYESLVPLIEPIFESTMAAIPQNTSVQNVFLQRIIQFSFGTVLVGLSFSLVSRTIECPGIQKFISIAGCSLTIFVLFGQTSFVESVSVGVVQEFPIIGNFLSCKLGRFALLAVSVLFIKSSKVKNTDIPLFFLLYYLQLYQLAFSATPNMFPTP